MVKPCRIRSFNPEGAITEYTCAQLRKALPRLEKEYLENNDGRKDRRYFEVMEEVESVLSKCKCLLEEDNH